MGTINLTEGEKRALAAIDRDRLRQAVEMAMDGGSLGEMGRLPLGDCGPSVAQELRYFLDAVRKYREAKSWRKVEETRDTANRAGRNLMFAIDGMQQRMEVEEREGDFFHVSDLVVHPITFRPKMDVRVSYRWRKSVEDDWKHGDITFTHVHEPRPSYGVSAPKRKPSAAKRAAALQEEMGREWDHLRLTALHTVRDFFRDGGDGSTIPTTFRAVTDSQGILNNFSARWWQAKPLDVAQRRTSSDTSSS